MFSAIILLSYLKEKWSKIYINNKLFKYYYFIKFKDKFIGEVYAKLNKEINSYEIGIVILGDYRGLHLATPSIKLLCEKLKEEGVKIYTTNFLIQEKAL